jgi:hypothetical protein
MNRILLALLAIFVFHASSSAAERIKIGYPDASGTFLSLPLGQKTRSGGGPVDSKGGAERNGNQTILDCRWFDLAHHRF